MRARSSKEVQRKRRHKRIRKKMKGTSVRPRLVIRRSLRNIFVQVVDDEARKTILSFSTLSKEAKDEIKMKEKTEQSRIIGLPRKCKDAGIETVVFDRSGYKYHGRVKALAEGAREGGLKF
jgi:large subunit ribosomal protein L18